MTTRPYFILDLDGTISKPGLREIFYVTHPRNYEAAEASVDFDDPIEHVYELVLVLQKSYDVVVLTARSDYCLEESKNWLTDKGIQFKDIYLREHKDYTPTAEFKCRTLKKICEKLGNPSFIFEDDPRNVSAMRALGFKVYTPDDLLGVGVFNELQVSDYQDN